MCRYWIYHSLYVFLELKTSSKTFMKQSDKRGPILVYIVFVYKLSFKQYSSFANTEEISDKLLPQ